MFSFFPRDVLDEILYLFESVSEGFPTYSCYFCESSCLFVLLLISISMFLRYCISGLGIFQANRTTKCLRNQCRTKGED